MVWDEGELAKIHAAEDLHTSVLREHGVAHTSWISPVVGDDALYVNGQNSRWYQAAITVLWLCSDGGAFTVGAAIVVDGGQTA